jgi:Tfp pilus assembly protein PilF
MTLRAHALACGCATLALAACETMPPPAPPPVQSITLLYQRPAERALITGLRLYEEGSFERADAALRSALDQGLRDGHDKAVAYKYLAFLACAYNRLVECEQNFRSAFAADPAFGLTETEIGHPIWGPIFRKVAASQPRR